MLVRLSGIAYESLVNGPGMRRVFFAQGCKHNCPGCFNTDTHCFMGGQLFDIDELVKDVLCNPIIKGVTFSGGDPLEQKKEFAYFAKKLKQYGYNIWCYTGYTIEELISIPNTYELLYNIDILVDGRFDKSKTSNHGKYKGSSNQRYILPKQSILMQKAVESKKITN